MKDFEKTNDSSPDAPQGGVKPRGHAHVDGRDASHTSTPVSHEHSDAAALSAPELTHPANAAPLANLLTQLQHSHGNVHVQRVVGELNQAKPDAESQSHSTGQPLDAGVKSQMESALGEAFGDVRVHTGSEAESFTEGLDARAVTRGRDIYFGKSEYNPATREGQELLAHELTHVVQQRGGSSSQGGSVGRVGDAFEQEADRAAALAARGERVLVERQGSAPVYQRQDAGVRTPQPTGPVAPPSFGVENVTVSSASPSGTLSNGWTYRLVPNRPGPSDSMLDIVVPEGVSATARSNRFNTNVYIASEFRRRVVLRERAVLVYVLGAQGQSGLVAVTFRFEARGVTTTLGTVMFNLRP